jgi:GTP-binding protein Era
LDIRHSTLDICYMPRCGTVVLAGRPNVGKSTLLNALVGDHLAIVSPKPQSTRLPVVGLLTRDDAQFIFTDSPGLLEPEYALHELMRAAALRALADAEVIAYLHPLAEYPAPPLEQVAGLPRPPRAPVLTVYTKADLARTSTALDRSRSPLTAFVSALTGEGLDELLAQLRAHLPEGPFHYDPDEMATQPMRFFAAEFVREAAFELLQDELPYSVAVEIDEFREGAKPVYIRAVILVERDSQKGIVIGAEGRTIKALGSAARAKIEALLGEQIFLELHVKLLPKWRRHAPSLKRLGYAG